MLHFTAREPAYGNQLIDRIESLTGGALHVNPNTMYPLLRSLEAQGMVAGEWEHPERRSRRFYRATEEGREELGRLPGELGPRLDRIAASIDAIRAELGRLMGRAKASISVPGRAAEAEALWYDPHRWQAWVDGFGHVVSLSDGWPDRGAELVWESPPGGRGRVTERVVAYEMRMGQTLEVEDATMTGRQTVKFEPGPEAVVITLSLEYRIKDRTPFTPIVDLLFVRRAMADALRRTVTRFSNERKAEIQFGSGTLGSGPMFVFKAAVVGAGVMGGEIAQVIAAADIPVLLKDVDQEFVDAGLRKAREVTEAQAGKLVAKEKLTAEQAGEQVERTLSLITGTTSYDGFGDVDFAIEAVPEQMEIKHEVFADLDAATPGHAVLASNTSGLSITEIGDATNRPDKVVGFHFFWPASAMRLIEIVEGEESSQATLQVAANFAQAIRKTPIRCAECPGFVVNRILTSAASEIWRTRTRRATPRRRSTRTSRSTPGCRWARSRSPT